jgi:mono/diheme cytochrome c family protein
MRVKYLAALAAAVGVLFSASTVIGQGADLTVIGQPVARMHCSGCHAMGRQDASPMPKAPPLRSLAKRYPLENVAEWLTDGAIPGHPALPELERSAVEALVGYIGAIAEQ